MEGMLMQKNLNTSILGTVCSQSEIIEQALTYKFKLIDIDIVEFANRAKTHGTSFARRLIDSANIEISAFSLPFGVETDSDVFQQDLARLADWVSVAGELGCKRCLMNVEPAGDRLPYHENFSFHQERLDAVCRVLETQGIRLGVGFRAAADLRTNRAFQFIHDLNALTMLVKMVGASNIGLLIDVWDLFVSGGDLDSLRTLTAEEVVAVYLADAPADVSLETLGETSRTLPEAEGRFNIPAALAALSEMGYDGPVSVKPHRDSLPTNGPDSIAKSLGESLDAVWQAAGLDAQGKLQSTPQDVEA